jgi:NADPH-dependent 2,4-dienoyl-CoA reductase/sulfur reductase-like enzyme
MSSGVQPGESLSSVVDLTILGAGPAGLAAAYYAGHRHASVRIVESLEGVGGQLVALYPEKRAWPSRGFSSSPSCARRRRPSRWRSLSWAARS